MSEENQDKPEKKRRKTGRPKVSEMKKMRRWHGKSTKPSKAPYVRVKPLKPKDTTETDAFRKRRRKVLHTNKHTMDQTIPREHNSLRFIGPTLRYFSVRYGIKTMDLMLCLNLYNSGHFTLEEFNKGAITIFGSCKTQYRRFMELGYMKRVMKTVIEPHKDRSKDRRKVFETDRFQLAHQVVLRLKFIYEVTDEIDVLNEENFDKRYAHPRIIEMVNKMEREVREVLSGKRSADKVVAPNKKEEE